MWRIACPNCGSRDTIIPSGRRWQLDEFFQQWHTCRDCGQQFQTDWEMTGLRTYGKQPVEKEQQQDGQMMLPGMT